MLEVPHGSRRQKTTSASKRITGRFYAEMTGMGEISILPDFLSRNQAVNSCAISRDTINLQAIVTHSYIGAEYFLRAGFKKSSPGMDGREVVSPNKLCRVISYSSR